MNFDEYKERYKRIAEESNIPYIVSEKELTKMYLSHVVMGQYNHELAQAAAAKKIILT